MVRPLGENKFKWTCVDPKNPANARFGDIYPTDGPSTMTSIPMYKVHPVRGVSGKPWFTPDRSYWSSAKLAAKRH